MDSLQLPFSAGVRGTGIYLDGDRQQVAAIGEANGNAAIMIEHIEKGPDHD